MNACYERYFPYEQNYSYSWQENEERLMSARKTREAVAYVVMGAIGSFGGMFLLLSSLQILPNGVNAISELGVLGKVIGGTILGLGVVTTLYGLIRYYDTCKGHKSPEPLQKPEPIHYTQKEAKVHFNRLLSRYYRTIERTAGCGMRVQCFIDNEWNDLNEFAQTYPELRSEVPEKVIQYDDGQGGLTGAANAFARALSPHYRALEPRIAAVPYDS